MPAIVAQGYAASLVVRQEKARNHTADWLPVIAEIRAGGATTLTAAAAIKRKAGPRPASMCAIALVFMIPSSPAETLHHRAVRDAA